MGALRSLLSELVLAPVVARALRQRDVPALVRLLAREATRAGAAAALGDLRAVEAIDPLVALLGASGVRRREAAAAALSRMDDGSGRIVTVLAAALDDPDPAVQTASADALLALGDPLAMRPPLARHEREVLDRVLAVVGPLVRAGLASVSVERLPAGEYGPPPPCIRVTPSAPTACPITVQVDHWEQVSLFMVAPTWDERWIPDRDEYLEWVLAGVSAVVDGRYEQWVRPGTEQAEAIFHLPGGRSTFRNNSLRSGDRSGFVRQTFTAYA